MRKVRPVIPESGVDDEDAYVLYPNWHFSDHEGVFLSYRVGEQMEGFEPVSHLYRIPPPNLPDERVAPSSHTPPG